MRREQLPLSSWLPTSRREMVERGWEQPDVILVSGDAYVDHPAFGVAVIGRVLEDLGLSVVILPQPNWRDDLRDFRRFGAPRLFFGVTAGNMDSMVNHYTAGKRLRSNDAYTAGGKAGFRPDYASRVYSRILKQIYPEVPVLLGGIEASLRRVTHYDYWSDKLLPSILVDSGADLLLYGMAEQGVRELVRLLQKGVPWSSLTTIPQSALLLPAGDPLPKNRRWETVELASHADCLRDRRIYSRNFALLEKEMNLLQGHRLTQQVGGQQVVINPAFPPIRSRALDAVYDLPYTRLPHPRYKRRGPIPAREMIKHSLTLHRGCFGGCSFCTIAAHQGRFISSRSAASIMRELEQVTELPGFKGQISDLGGPSANMYRMGGRKMDICADCSRPSCIAPAVCANLDLDHGPLLEIYRAVQQHPAVTRAAVSSGIRYDLLQDRKGNLRDRTCQQYLEQVVRHHVSGRLKVAPEHTEELPLKLVRKPSFNLFLKFRKFFEQISRQAGLKLQLIPYFISGLPGSGEAEMAQLALKTKKLDYRLEQVQDFTPTPLTLATVIFYSGIHPETGETVSTATGRREKEMQRRYLLWYKPENRRRLRARLEQLQLDDVAQQLFTRGQDSNHR